MTTKVQNKAWDLFPDAFMCHYAVANIIHTCYPTAKSIIDMGGIARLRMFTNIPVTDANKRRGVDGRNLPFKDNSFDVCVSINTLEHVDKKEQFISEAKRVSRLGIIFCFPFDGKMTEIEKLKKEIGHNHNISRGGFPTIELVNKWMGKTGTMMFCMPHWLHLSFIAGLKRMSPAIKRTINKNLVANTKPWLAKEKNACTVIMNFKN